MRRSLRLLLPGVLMAPLLVLPMESADAEGDRPLVILEEDEPQTTYPFLSRTMSEQRLGELLFDRFFTLTKGGDLVSPVFEPGWTASAPNLSLTVNEGLKFADGSPATFSDVTFTFNDVYRRTDLGHNLGAWYGKVFGDAQQITPMVGSVRFGVQMPDEGSERYLLTTVLLSRGNLGKGGRPDLEGSKRQPVGTGPFWAAEPIESFDDVLLQRNPHRAVKASGDRKPVSSLRLQYDQDAASQKELMEGGRADVWVSPPPALLPPFKNQSDRYGIRSYDLNQWWYVSVNHDNPHLRNGQVREAVDMVVPRSQLVEKFGSESARLTSGPFLPGSAWESGEASPTTTSKAQAGELMKAAGYTLESGYWTKAGDTVTLRFGVQGDILDDYNDVVYGMVDAWEDAGFRIRLRSVRSADWRTQVESGKASGSYDLLMGRWNIDREEGAIELFTKNPSKGRKTNLFNYNNDIVNLTVKQYYEESSGPKREALMQRLHKQLHDDRPYLFLWTLQVQSIYRRDRLAGFRPAPFYYYTSADGIVWKGDAK